MSGDDPEHPEGWWEPRRDALEKVLGKPDGTVGHAPVPFDLGPDVGGAADVLYFRQHLTGVVAVTAELIGRDDQPPSSLGNYELMICEKGDPSWGASLISRLAHYTLEVPLEPGETMDIGSAVPPGSTIVALLFSEYSRFDVLQRECGLLLCIGITEDELADCQRGLAEEVEAALRNTGTYPFTDLERASVVVGADPGETKPQ